MSSQRLGAALTPGFESSVSELVSKVEPNNTARALAEGGRAKTFHFTGWLLIGAMQKTPLLPLCSGGGGSGMGSGAA